MENQNLLEDILDTSCSVIYNSIIIKTQFEHNIDNVILDNTKCDFINKVREYLMYFFCNINNSNLEYHKNALFDNILNLFKEDIFTFINSRADLDMCKIRKAINKGIEDWLL